jgi:hypothetical protein
MSITNPETLPDLFGYLVLYAAWLVVKLRLKPPSDGDGGDGESSLPGGRVAAATKTAFKAERDEKLASLTARWSFRRCLGPG